MVLRFWVLGSKFLGSAMDWRNLEPLEPLEPENPTLNPS